MCLLSTSACGIIGGGDDKASETAEHADDAAHSESDAEGAAAEEGAGHADGADDAHADDAHADDAHADGTHADDPKAGEDSHAAGDGAHEDDGHAAAPAAHGAHWTYAGETGPENWGSLDETYEACATGLEQSPINLAKGSAANLADLEFHYKPSRYEVVDNGHTVQVNLTSGGTLTVDGHEYDLVQFHFHAPSEHTLDGTSYKMEVHFVHKDSEGKLAVVGVFFTEAARNPELDFVFDNMPDLNDARPGVGLIDPSRLLPEYRATVRYAGSLTTPPCSEGVKWNVFLMPIQASKEQIATFAARHNGSNRPVQPIGDRKVQVDLDAAAGGTGAASSGGH